MAAPWRLEEFLPCLDSWIAREEPSDDLRVIVTDWVVSRYDDPYEGVRREPGFDNLWFGAVPHTHHGRGLVVTCVYWIEESRHVVRCDSFATLSLPL